MRASTTEGRPSRFPRRLARRWGLGAAGLVLLGPLGLLGALATKKKVTFLATLKDGRRFLATANQKIYQAILAATI